MDEQNFHAQCPTDTLQKGFLFVEPIRLEKPPKTTEPNPSPQCPLTVAQTLSALSSGPISSFQSHVKHLCIPALTVPRGFSGAELGLCGAAGAIELALLGLGPPMGAGECGLLW